MVLKLRETLNSTKCIDIFKHIQIDFHEFCMHKCDERTFYISIMIKNGNDKEICDLIFLLDRPNVLGAISLNEKYDKVRHFLKKRLNYDLSYSDEQRIASFMMSTNPFKKCLHQFSNHFPKHIAEKRLLH